MRNHSRWSRSGWLRVVAALGLVHLVALVSPVTAREPAKVTAMEPTPHDHAPPNVVFPTLGGLQLWSDVLYFHGWHIQRHVATGHHRLLDERNCRHAWGTFEQCQARLEEIKREQNLPPMQGRGVIVMHGLIRTRASMNRLCDYLRQKGGFTVFNLNYPSTRARISEHAAALASVVGHLEGIEEIHFVTHSLGGLVMRHWLADQMDPANAGRPDPRLRRIVMLAPPNQGAEIAEKLGRNPVFTAIFGQAGRQLAREWNDLEGKLAIPPCEFGILAGGRGNERGRNFLLTGDDDLIVTVASTRLPGARDFLVLPVGHTFLMNDRWVQECTLRFLEHGYFLSEEERQPIPLEPEEVQTKRAQPACDPSSL